MAFSRKERLIAGSASPVVARRKIMYSKKLNLALWTYCPLPATNHPLKSLPEVRIRSLILRTCCWIGTYRLRFFLRTGIFSCDREGIIFRYFLSWSGNSLWLFGKFSWVCRCLFLLTNWSSLLLFAVVTSLVVEIACPIWCGCCHRRTLVKIRVCLYVVFGSYDVSRAMCRYCRFFRDLRVMYCSMESLCCSRLVFSCWVTETILTCHISIIDLLEEKTSFFVE